MTESGLVERTLAGVATETSTMLTHYLAEREPRQWLGTLAMDYPERGGKAIRPALSVQTCQAFGGEADEVILSAAAIELLHNAFLVHDDIEDESEQRRGRPTLHQLFGIPLALNTGDAMAMAAMAMLRDNRPILGSFLSDRVVQEFELMVRNTVEGQAIELGWRRDGVTDLDELDYLDLIVRKTCWYTTIHPIRVGALIGGWGRIPLDDLTRFGLYLGAAFQIQDDLLNLVGDQSAYGKEILGDLFEGKRTLMLIHLLQELDPSTRSEVRNDFLMAPRSERSRSDVDSLLALMHEHGSIEYARAFADGIRSKAAESFDDAFRLAPQSTHRRFLHEMVDFMLDRQV